MLSNITSSAHFGLASGGGVGFEFRLTLKIWVYTKIRNTWNTQNAKIGPNFDTLNACGTNFGWNTYFKVLKSVQPFKSETFSKFLVQKT